MDEKEFEEHMAGWLGKQTGSIKGPQYNNVHCSFTFSNKDSMYCVSSAVHTCT